MIVQLVLKAWKELQSEMVAQSFKSCALTVTVDGSEDDEISCFKPDKPCSDGRKRLSDQMCLLNDTSLDQDPFQSPTESDIEDAGNEMLLIEDDVDIC